VDTHFRAATSNMQQPVRALQDSLRPGGPAARGSAEQIAQFEELRNEIVDAPDSRFQPTTRISCLRARPSFARNSRLMDGVLSLRSRPFPTTDSGRHLARTCLGCKHPTNRKRRMTTHPPATRTSHRIEHETTSAGCRNRTNPATPGPSREAVARPQLAGCRAQLGTGGIQAMPAQVAVSPVGFGRRSARSGFFGGCA
jgi:hypothetical protein